jgi:hypothetical protein
MKPKGSYSESKLKAATVKCHLFHQVLFDLPGTRASTLREQLMQQELKLRGTFTDVLKAKTALTERFDAGDVVHRRPRGAV